LFQLYGFEDFSLVETFSLVIGLKLKLRFDVRVFLIGRHYQDFLLDQFVQYTEGLGTS
jgi:hypothetical protein